MNINKKSLIFIAILGILLISSVSAFSISEILNNIFSKMTGNPIYESSSPIFSDSFSNNASYGNWNLWGMKFEISNGQLKTISAPREGFNYGHAGNGRAASAFTHIGDTSWVNYTVNMDVTNLPKGSFNPYGVPDCYTGNGISFRVMNAKESWNEAETSAYAFGLASKECSWSAKGSWNLVKSKGYWIPGTGWNPNNQGSSSVLLSGTVPTSVVNDNTNHFTITVLGNRIIVSVNNYSVLDYVDTQNDLSYGGIGVSWGWESMGSVDNIVVTPVSSNIGTNSNQTNTTYTCRDSDNGLNYYIAGNVTFGSCTYGSNGGGCGGSSIGDSCLGNTSANPGFLRETYCTSDNRSSFNDYQCPNGCLNGACVNQSVSANPCSNYTYNSPYGYAGNNNFNILNNYSHQQGYCVQLLSPNSIENLTVGSIYPIRWKQHNVQTVSLGLKHCSSCLDWINYSLGVNASENQVYYWNVSSFAPYGVGSNYNFTVLIIAQDNDNLSEDGSDNFFNIINPVNTQVCSSLIDAVKNPTETDERRLSWNNTYSSNVYINGRDELFNSYQAGWYWNNPDYNSDPQNNQMNYYYTSYEVQVFDNKNINLSEYASWNTDNLACRPYYIWTNDGEQTYYICNWDALNNVQDLNNYQGNNRQIYWYNDNVFVRMYIYYGNQLTDEQLIKLSQIKLNNLLNSLVDNRARFVEWNNFEVQWPANNEISSSISQCSSDISADNVNWECKTEPVICPEYGYQNQICTAWKDGGQVKRENKIYCSPGICSGCYVPRWFGGSDNVCLPYGTRFLQESKKVNTETLYAKNGSGDPGSESLIVTSNNSATITFYWDNGYNTYNFVKGETLNFYMPNVNVEINWEIVDIHYSEDNTQSYIVIKSYTDNSVNAYCNYDGNIMQQKTKDANGDWAKCQNSYECESNQCSSGECIPVQQFINQGSSLRNLGVRILCRFANLFDGSGYDQCLIDYGAK